jgi:hypothetical protein
VHGDHVGHVVHRTLAAYGAAGLINVQRDHAPSPSGSSL